MPIKKFNYLSKIPFFAKTPAFFKPVILIGSGQ